MRFSTLELLGNAGFIGFEGALLAIALASLLPTPLLGLGLWMVTLLGLIVGQYFRMIERWDLLLISVLTLVGVVWYAPAHAAVPGTGSVLLTVLLLAALAGCGVIAVVSLFRLIYKLLSQII
ncbi:hypothetical protein [Neosynechococcus sphagnicola]|uniref:hypothetical protein n=1 Tax=Neosynechococcus sphagnicola TaxID=1501145 RepID=UPI001EF9D17F|nr:hypothetical protein [Neosynechococcus sphagnicola]